MGWEDGMWWMRREMCSVGWGERDERSGLG